MATTMRDFIGQAAETLPEEQRVAVLAKLENADSAQLERFTDLLLKEKQFSHLDKCRHMNMIILVPTHYLGSPDFHAQGCTHEDHPLLEEKSSGSANKDPRKIKLTLEEATDCLLQKLSENQFKKKIGVKPEEKPTDRQWLLLGIFWACERNDSRSIALRGGLNPNKYSAYNRLDRSYYNTQRPAVVLGDLTDGEFITD